MSDPVVKNRLTIVANDNKFYEYKKLSSGETLWRCTKKSCNAKLYTRDAQITRFETKHTHQTPGDGKAKRVKREASESDPKKKSNGAKTAKINILKNEQIAGGPAVKDEEPVDPLAIREEFDKVHSEIYTKEFLTDQSENFLLHNDPIKRILIFSCATNINFLCSADTIYLDTTFGCCPKPYEEILCVHAFSNGVYIPLVFCLLANKSIDTYESALLALHDQCSRLKCHLTPCEVVIDFKKNAYKALIRIWPTVSVVGCRFHLSQIWYRKLCELGLSSDYKNPNSETGRWLRYAFGLIYLQPLRVKTEFETDLATLKPSGERIAKFYGYLQRNFIEDRAPFPPYIWASSAFDPEHVTNVCESFDSYFTVCFSSHDPNVFQFIFELKKFQREIYSQIYMNKKHNYARQSVEKPEEVKVMVEKIDYDFQLAGF